MIIFRNCTSGLHSASNKPFSEICELLIEPVPQSHVGNITDTMYTRPFTDTACWWQALIFFSFELPYTRMHITSGLFLSTWGCLPICVWLTAHSWLHVSLTIRSECAATITAPIFCFSLVGVWINWMYVLLLLHCGAPAVPCFGLHRPRG